MSGVSGQPAKGSSPRQYLIALAPGISSITIASDDVVHDRSADVEALFGELLGSRRQELRGVGYRRNSAPASGFWHIRLKRPTIKPVDARRAEEQSC